MSRQRPSRGANAVSSRWGLFAAFVALTCACSGSSGSFAGDCGDELVSEAASPGGVFTAVVFVRNCGATTGYATHVGMRRRGGDLSEAARNIVFSIEGTPELRILWPEDRRLRIEYPGARVLPMAPEWRDVVIDP